MTTWSGTILTRVRDDRQLTKRAALSESLREPSEMAPGGGLQAIPQLSGRWGREPGFARYWPFCANSRVAGSQPEEMAIRGQVHGSPRWTRFELLRLS